MKKLLVVLILLVAVPLMAQQATFNSQVTRPAEDNFRAISYMATRDGGGRWEVVVGVFDTTGNTEIRRVTFSGPDVLHPSATALAFLTAQMNARSGETGGNVRRMDFRVLGFLADNSYISNVTLAP